MCLTKTDDLTEEYRHKDVTAYKLVDVVNNEVQAPFMNTPVKIDADGFYHAQTLQGFNKSVDDVGIHVFLSHNEALMAQVVLNRAREEWKAGCPLVIVSCICSAQDLVAAGYFICRFFVSPVTFDKRTYSFQSATYTKVHFNPEDLAKLTQGKEQECASI